MKEYKLITILKTFSKEEMKNFGKFISSPYFNSNRNYDRLYSLLKKFHPEFPPEKFTVEKIFQSLYPGKKFNKNKSSVSIRVLLSQMTVLAKKYMVYDWFELGKNSYDLNENAVFAYVERGLLKLALQTEVKNSDALNKGEKGHEFYNRRLMTNHWLYFLSRNGDFGRRRDYFKYEKNSLLYLYAFLFENIASLLNDNSLYKWNKDISLNGIEVAMSIVSAFDPGVFNYGFKDDGFETKNLTIFNYYIIKSRLNENDIDNLLKAAECFYKFFPNVSELNQFNGFVRLWNLFIIRRHLGRIYSVKANELFDYVWSKGTYGDRFIDPYGYRRALNLKLYLLSGVEVRKFIDTYTADIKIQIREDIRNYSLAHLYFKEKLFGKCLEYVSKKDELGPPFRPYIYRLKMCSLFEEGLYEEAAYAAESLEHYIKRNRKEIVPAEKNHTEFLKAFRYLMNLESRGPCDNDVKFPKNFMINKYSIWGEWFEEKNKELLDPVKSSTAI